MMLNQSLPSPRAKLAAVLRAANTVISIDLTAKTLGLGRQEASKLLSRWLAQGWLRRVGAGLYVSVPLDLAESEQVMEDPWVLVPTLFADSYIGGWTAAHHWELTEQLFNNTVVLTTNRIAKKYVTAQGAIFFLHRVPNKPPFGIKTIWRGSTKVSISNAERTLIDMIAMPEIGGGIDHIADCLETYLSNKTSNYKLLIEYAEQFGNGAVFKRLGFLAEYRFRHQGLSIACRDRLTQGYTKLDSALSCTQLITSWRIWIPARYRGIIK